MFTRGYINHDYQHDIAMIWYPHVLSPFSSIINIIIPTYPHDIPMLPWRYDHPRWFSGAQCRSWFELGSAAVRTIRSRGRKTAHGEMCEDGEDGRFLGKSGTFHTGTKIGIPSELAGWSISWKFLVLWMIMMILGYTYDLGPPHMNESNLWEVTNEKWERIKLLVELQQK